MSAAPDLVIDSVTGVDVALPVAGPGTRSYAFVIDWCIRVVLALCWYSLAALIHNRGASVVAPLTNEPRWFGAVVAPALAIYFLYHYVVEVAMRGSTPGKRMAGVRIVARDGRAPGLGALLARNVFRIIDCLPVFYGLGLATVMLTREHLRIGDMAAGTLLVFEHVTARPAGALATATVSGAHAADMEIIAELLERWPTLEPQARLRLGQQLLTRLGGDPAELAACDEATCRNRLERLTAPA
jgi:uncharacterized RDD family membrane protein YckC